MLFIKKIVIYYSLTLLLCFIAGVFIEASFNLSRWQPVVRQLLFGAWIVFGIFYCLYQVIHWDSLPDKYSEKSNEQKEADRIKLMAIINDILYNK